MNTVRAVRRSQKLSQKIVAFSISYDDADGRPRGIGAEHLREALLQMARPVLHAQAAIAYGGHLDPVPLPGSNFTLDILNVIREEQQERISGSADIRGLYNFQAWPSYLRLSREKEAEWINCCQIVRITQQMAGFSDPLPDKLADGNAVQRFIHGAVCLSAMRRFMAEGCEQQIEGTPATPTRIPSVSARIALGGKISGFAGIMPGIFEEILLSRESKSTISIPIFILGGFGGAAGVLARMLLAGGVDADEHFTTGFYAKVPDNSKDPGFTDLLKQWGSVTLPSGARSPEQGFDALRTMLKEFEKRPSDFLNNGLNDDDNRKLLTTIDPMETVRLVLRGLAIVL